MAPATSQADPVDVSEVCDSLIGSNDVTIDLSPLARANIKTCKLADTRG